MACSPCEKRREMTANAYQDNGWKGVLEILPDVAKDVIKHPPHILDIRARTVRNG